MDIEIDNWFNLELKFLNEIKEKIQYNLEKFIEKLSPHENNVEFISLTCSKSCWCPDKVFSSFIALNDCSMILFNSFMIGSHKV